MLLYHPFFDANHCAFRMLRLLAATPLTKVELDRLRIWDFYLLFPSHLSRATLPKGSYGIRKFVDSLKNPYDVLPNARRAFIRLEPIQTTALAHLASIALIEAKQLQEGIISRTSNPIPEGLIPTILERNEREKELVAYLTGIFLRTPLHGKGGLRSRIDLFDDRYDLP